MLIRELFHIDEGLTAKQIAGLPQLIEAAEFGRYLLLSPEGFDV